MSKRIERLSEKPPPKRSDGSEGAAAMTMHIKVVTPILGGAPKARESDSLTPIRGSGIRGSLRYWWRALYASGFKDPEALRQAEGALWGGVALVGVNPERPQERGARKSRVGIVVKVLDKGSKPRVVKDDPAYKVRTNKGYALFSARFEKEGRPGAVIRSGVSFELRVELPKGEKGQQQVINSLRAMLLFGGIGGRTRRGLGTLALQSVKATGELHISEASNLIGFWYPPGADLRKPMTSLPTWVRGLIAHSKSKAVQHDVPSLVGAQFAYISNQASDDADEIWNSSVEKWREFRQYPINRRNGQKQSIRVSRWPEADVIRRAQGNLPKVNGKVLPSYPRAALGLPVQFELHMAKKEEGARPTASKKAYTLMLEANGVEIERFASPIIVKAMAVAPDLFIPIALRLNVEMPKGQFYLKSEKEEVRGTRVSTEESIPEALRPIKPLGKFDNALDAFMHSASAGQRLVQLGGGK